MISDKNKGLFIPFFLIPKANDKKCLHNNKEKVCDKYTTCTKMVPIILNFSHITMVALDILD